MKRLFLTSTLALAIAAGATAPAHAAVSPTFMGGIRVAVGDVNPFSYLIYLLVPAVQAAR